VASKILETGVQAQYSIIISIGKPHAPSGHLDPLGAIQPVVGIPAAGNGQDLLQLRPEDPVALLSSSATYGTAQPPALTLDDPGVAT